MKPELLQMLEDLKENVGDMMGRDGEYLNVSINKIIDLITENNTRFE